MRPFLERLAEPKRSKHTGMPYALTGIRQLREAMLE